MDSVSGFDPRLIFDIGMSEGNDADFYLRKGFRVTGIEADAAMIGRLESRFAAEIGRGELLVLHRAAAAVSGKRLTFWHNESAQGHSSLDEQRGRGAKQPAVVESIAWPELCAAGGVPYYLKIDIEGGEVAFLESMLGAPRLPPYISVECHSFEPIEMLHRLGYRAFKLVNQTILRDLSGAEPQQEGERDVPIPAEHASGLFGRDLPGVAWLDLCGVAQQFAMIRQLRAAGGIFQPWVWFDCHARLGRA